MKKLSALLIHKRSLDWIVSLLGVVGLVIFLRFYDQAFPSAALHLVYSRAQITEMAKSYMQEHGYDLTEYEFALAFESDNAGSFFLQRQLGIEKTNQLIAQENIPLWYWHARWFKPLQEEEFSLYLLPDGQINNFTHTLPETMEGAALEAGAAEQLAKAYLSGERGWNLENWQQVGSSSRQRSSGRLDHEFEWKRQNFNVDDSELRLKVIVKGDGIGYYDYRLKTPDLFWREFSKAREWPNTITAVGIGFSVIIFGLIAIVCCLLAYLQGVRLFRQSLLPAGLVGLVSLLAGLNSLPLDKVSYPTTSDYWMFWASQVTLVVAYALLQMLLILLILEGGLYIARQMWPYQDKLLGRSPDRWLELSRSSWRGLMLGGLLLGYMVAFYLGATQVFGAWVPAGADYSDIYATPLPFLSSLEMGLTPATMEETLSRLVGISILLLLFRKKWLALLVPGALWAFAHLSYIRDPFYLRGIELLLPAVFIEGLFFLTFDLTTTIVAHMAYNAALGLIPMLLSGEPTFMASGVVGTALLFSPVLVGMVMSWTQRARGRHLEQGWGVSPRLRLAVPEDQERLQALLPEGQDWPALLADPGVIVVCLDAGEKITGAAVCKLAAGSDPDGAARLAWVYVAPAWRGQLWGSRLVDQAAQQLRERGATHIEAEIETGDRAIRSFLGSKGWYSLRLVLAPREQPYLVEWWQSSRYALKKNDQKLEAWLRKKLRSMRRPVVNQE